LDLGLKISFWQFPWTTEQAAIRLDAAIVHIATEAEEMSWAVVV
jgi:hypothetical protein